MTLDQDFRFTRAEGSLYTDAVGTPQESGAEPRLVEDLRLLLGDSGFLALVLLPFDRSLGSIVLAQPDRFGDSSPSVSVQLLREYDHAEGARGRLEQIQRILAVSPGCALTGGAVLFGGWTTAPSVMSIFDLLVSQRECDVADWLRPGRVHHDTKKTLMRAVARGRGGLPGEVRQCSGKQREWSIRPLRGTSKG